MVRHGWRGAFWSDAWRVPAPAGAKRHMPGLHTARPHLQLQCYGIAIAQFGGIFATSWNWRQLVCSNAPLLCPQAESSLATFDFDAVIADKGYDSDPLRDLLAAQQIEVVIPSCRYRKQPRDYDRIRYRERNIVERFINKIKWYRRIFTRYDKLARRFMAFLHFASTLIWLERNVNEP